MQVIYGEEQVTFLDDKSFQIRLSAANSNDGDPLGARLEYRTEAMKGRFCSRIKTQSVSGNAFAMYLTTDEPIDRELEKWDELDFELLGHSPDQVWTNAFHDGKADNQGWNVALPNGASSDDVEMEYCFVWHVGQTAQWLIDGTEVRSMSLQGWTKRLHPVISFWGSKRDVSSLTSWSGVQLLFPTMNITGTAREITITDLEDTAPSIIN